MARSLSIFCLTNSFLIICALGLAQDSVYLGNISGRVTDVTGAVIQGAQVAVRHTETNLSASGMTGTDGRFRFPFLRVGPYEIRVTQRWVVL